MIKSKNDFFKKDKYQLLSLKMEVYKLLFIKRRNHKEILEYLEAFDYFIQHPDKYDGATIVQDLCDIPRLDLDAMLHDYEYIVNGANRDFVKKWKSDLKYIQYMQKNGKGLRIIRMIALTLIGIVYVPYNLIIK
jgi:hypothetical protein